jgi:hypothetical protein
MSDDQLDELSGKLPALDIDPALAATISAAGRRDVVRGRSTRRFVEPVLVTLLVASFLVWAVWKAFF